MKFYQKLLILWFESFFSYLFQTKKANELNWTEEKKKEEFDYAMEYLKTMGSEFIDIYDEGGEK